MSNIAEFMVFGGQTVFSQVNAKTNMTGGEKLLQTVLGKAVNGMKIFWYFIYIRKGDFNWLGASGNISKKQPYFIASTTKLFTTAIVLHLNANGELALEDKISNYWDKSLMSDWYVYEGKGYSNKLTIKHLMAHSSGLPDYVQGKGTNGKSGND